MVLFLSLGCIISVSFLGDEEPPIIYVQDVYIIILECVEEARKEGCLLRPNGGC